MANGPWRTVLPICWKSQRLGAPTPLTHRCRGLTRYSLAVTHSRKKRYQTGTGQGVQVAWRSTVILYVDGEEDGRGELEHRNDPLGSVLLVGHSSRSGRSSDSGHGFVGTMHSPRLFAECLPAADVQTYCSQLKNAVESRGRGQQDGSPSSAKLARLWKRALRNGQLRSVDLSDNWLPRNVIDAMLEGLRESDSMEELELGSNSANAAQIQELKASVDVRRAMRGSWAGASGDRYSCCKLAHNLLEHEGGWSELARSCVSRRLLPALGLSRSVLAKSRLSLPFCRRCAGVQVVLQQYRLPVERVAPPSPGGCRILGRHAHEASRSRREPTCKR